VCDGIGLQRLDSRDEPPLIEESTRSLDPRRSEESLASREVFSDGGEQGVVAGVSRQVRFGSNDAVAIVDRRTLEELHAPKGWSKSSRLVSHGKALADLEADVGDTRALIGHPFIAEAGCLNPPRYPSSFLAMTTRWT
jgi:hypothetical protein